MKEIPLANTALVALIDDEVWPKVSKHKWCIHRGGGKKQRIYAQTNMKLGDRFHRVLMHRFIMGALPGELCDHRDNNGLNNQMGNLRFATPSQNQQNQKTKTTRRFKGLKWCKRSSRWIAKIRHLGKCVHIGAFRSEEEAAKAYDAKVRIIHGEFACLNFK